MIEQNADYSYCLRYLPQILTSPQHSSSTVFSNSRSHWCQVLSCYTRYIYLRDSSQSTVFEPEDTDIKTRKTGSGSQAVKRLNDRLLLNMDKDDFLKRFSTFPAKSDLVARTFQSCSKTASVFITQSRSHHIWRLALFWILPVLSMLEQ